MKKKCPVALGHELTPEAALESTSIIEMKQSKIFDISHVEFPLQCNILVSLCLCLCLSVCLSVSLSLSLSLCVERIIISRERNIPRERNIVSRWRGRNNISRKYIIIHANAINIIGGGGRNYNSRYGTIFRGTK